MQLSLRSLTEMFDTIKIIRDADFDALGMATSRYGNERVLSFLASEKYLPDILANPNITAIITSQDLAEKLLPYSYGIATSSAPKAEFYKVHNHLVDLNFYGENFAVEIDPSAKVSKYALLPEHSLKIGRNSIVEAQVVIHPGVVIGDDCIIRSGAQIANSGFQFLNHENTVISVKSAGRVVIDDRVEVRHLSCIDKGVFSGNTHLFSDCKIDNLVHVAHDVEIRDRAMIVAGSVIGGRTIIEEDVWLGINSSVANGLVIGKAAYITMGAVVTRDVPAGAQVTGNFAIEHKKFLSHLRDIR